MRHIIYIIMLLLAMATPPTEAQNTVQYSRQDSIMVERIIHIVKSKRQLSDTLLYIARCLKGVPYVAKTLEVNDREQLIVNLRQLDCTTYVETVLAIYLCCKERKTTFEDFCTNLRRIRYADSEVAYSTRLHYFSWWIESNTHAGIVREITSCDAPFTKTQTLDLHFMSRNSQLYPMLKNNSLLIKDIADREQRLCGTTVRYIPKDSIDNSALLKSTIRDGDILAIVTNKAGLDISHVGFAVWKKDGLHLLNASQIRKRVVEEPQTLHDYMAKRASQIGIRVVRVNR